MSVPGWTEEQFGYDERPGVCVEGGKLKVRLHRAYGEAGLTEDEKFQAALRLIAVLRKFHREKQQRSVKEGEQGAVKIIGSADGSGVDRLEAALLLLADWRSDGPVPFTEQRLVEEKPGRIDWERTRRQYPPVDGPGGLVFSNLLLRRVEPHWNHPVQLLQRYTVREIQRMLGQSVDILPVQLPEPPLRILQTWSHRCFTDRQRRLLVLLNRYWHGQSATRSNHLTAGIYADPFAYVWQEMTMRVLGGEQAESIRYPYVRPDESEVEGLSVTPDFMLNIGEDKFICDAKDYGFGKFPESKSINKQIAYWLLCVVEKIKKNKKYERNMFIMLSVFDGNVQYAGSIFESNIFEIKCIFLNLKIIEESYIRNYISEKIKNEILNIVK